MRGIQMHLNELWTAFGVVAGLIAAPPGEAASDGPDRSMYQMIVKIILIVMTTGWVLTGITAKIAYDQASKNQEVMLNEFKCMRGQQDTLLREHEVVKNTQARVVEELKNLHTMDEEMWRFLRGTSNGRK